MSASEFEIGIELERRGVYAELMDVEEGIYRWREGGGVRGCGSKYARL